MNIKKILSVFLTLGLLILLTFTFVWAQGGRPPREAEVPDAPQSSSQYIPVQGKLTDPNGNPLSGDYLLTYSLYGQSTGGTALCTDTDTVTVDHGLWQGYMNAIGCPIDGRQLYLGLKVGSDPEMTPRTYIDNVPYAWGLKPGAVISGTIGGGPIVHIENWSVSGRGLRSYAMAQTGENYGMVGASRSPSGYGGYFYNNGGGTGLYGSSNTGTGILAVSTSGYALSASSTDGIGILASSNTNEGLWATSVTQGGVHGASGSGAGVEGFSLTGPGVYASSLTGAAIAADGIITSTAPTYLWVSGNGVREFGEADSTIIDMNSRGGARITRGGVVSYKNVILPITIAGTLYGQNVKITDLELYWKGDTNLDSIVTIRLRRQTGVCNACFQELLVDIADYICFEDDNPNGCTIQETITNNNVLSDQSGIIYLTMELAYAGNTWIDFDGIRLTLEYDN